jgi:arabinofuranan 3-O-arabinosyltransferase
VPSTAVAVPRRWLWLVAAIALVCSFAQSPGRVSPDTKLDLTADPARLLARAANLWNSDLPFGQAQNQAYGYLFPHGAFFLAGDLAGLPVWVTHRLWWSVLLTVGFWGLLRVAEALTTEEASAARRHAPSAPRRSRCRRGY